MNPVPMQQPEPPNNPIVWRKGWLYPIFYGIMLLAMTGLFGFLTFGTGRPDATSFVLPGLCFVGMVGAFTAAFRRKLTLTTDTVVVRTLWRNKTIPLRDINNLTIARISNNPFAANPVMIQTANNGSIRTNSFGINQGEGISQLVELAVKQGAQIYGFNAEREQGTV